MTDIYASFRTNYVVLNPSPAASAPNGSVFIDSGAGDVLSSKSVLGDVVPIGSAPLGGDSNGDWTTEQRTVTSGEISAEQLLLAQIPRVPTEVVVTFTSGITVKYGDDYLISGNIFLWAGKGLAAVIEEGDTILFGYFF